MKNANIVNPKIVMKLFARFQKQAVPNLKNYLKKMIKFAKI